ncbi:MAG: class I SAM-dependent methyltransferase [Betaproteobacteria bacterium]|nr:class I SAM-dependent methyltransferase [Betaproteobacteria bacterium]
MNLIERATIMHFHRHRIAEYGRDGVMALGWRNADSQSKRFEVIASLADFTGSTVLDVGCGRGDLKAFLDQRFADVAYLGIDQMPEFIADANARYAGGTPCRFYEGDFSTAAFPRVDYVIASGALGYRSVDNDFLFDMICRLYASSGRAAIFNVLDAQHFPDHPLLLGRDCDAVVAYCRTLSPLVEVVKGYLPDDMTVRITRPEAERI